jgi:pyruvate/2-oxoglutarate dehydrogenase complex dihydrolipoamide acyltransferase (E2) component
VTWVEECDFSHVELHRLVPLVLHAVTQSLREYPELNSRVENGELVLLDRYDIGVAVQIEQGLVVPVVHGCDRLSLEELDAEVRRLAEAAAAGTLKPEELRGGTFTVTSAGKAAGLFVTPLINHPEVAILGVHRIEERPVVRDGEVVVRRMGNISVTFDHRVIDGKRAAEFGLAVIAQLEMRSL